METFKDHPQMGRFTLRDEGLSFFFLLTPFFVEETSCSGACPLFPCLTKFAGKTVAIGKVLKIVDAEGAEAAGAAAPAEST